MSDDKTPKNPPPSDGTGSGSGTDSAGKTDGTPAVGFGELMGFIDERIRSALGGGTKKTTEPTADPKSDTPESVAQQVRNELAKLQGEDAAKQKEADRDVTIQQLQEQVTKLSEAAPTQQVSKLSQFVWGSRSKAKKTT